LIDAVFFDGKSARPQSVRIAFQTNDIVVSNAEGLVLRHPLINANIDESFKGAARRIDLGGGALLEVLDKQALQTALDAQGLRLSSVQKAQNSWAWVSASVAALIGFLALSYYILIPFAATHIAGLLPESVDKAIGEQAWPVLQEQLFKPSKLAPERQQEVRQKFADAVAKLPNPPFYRLEFRGSNMGPNAVAIPGGTIVMTDELMALSTSDDAILGVLLHELGHLKQRHSLRNIIQLTAVTAVVSIWLGDVSGVVALLPTTLATMKYSRDFENEADDFAVAALKTLKIPGRPIADLFVAMEQASKPPNSPGPETKPDSKPNAKSATESVFSSHPVTSVRIKKFTDIQ
jgi:Zn-dependent protease with chaperone function